MNSNVSRRRHRKDASVVRFLADAHQFDDSIHTYEDYNSVHHHEAFVAAAPGSSSPPYPSRRMSLLPIADLQCAATMFLQLLWSEGHDVLLCATRLLSTSTADSDDVGAVATSSNPRRRLSAGGAPDPTAVAMKRQLEGASKYGVLAALHIARCPGVQRSVWGAGGYEFLAPDEIASQALLHNVSRRSNRQEVGAASETSTMAACKKLVRSVSVFLITFFQEKFIRSQHPDAAGDAEELLSCALRILPGCFCIEREDMPLVALLFPELLVTSDHPSPRSVEHLQTLRCVCRHEWSRGVMPQLAVSMVFEQFSAQDWERRVLRHCLRHWRLRRLNHNKEVSHPAAMTFISSPPAVFARDTNDAEQLSLPLPQRSDNSCRSDGIHTTAAGRTKDVIVQPDDKATSLKTRATSTAALPSVSSSSAKLHDDETEPRVPQFLRGPIVVLQGRQALSVDEGHASAPLPASLPPSAAPTPIIQPPIDECVRSTFTHWKQLTLDPYTKEAVRTSEAYHLAQVHALRARRVHLVHQRSSALKLLRVAFEQWRDVYVPQEQSLRWCEQQQQLRRKQSSWVQWRRRFLTKEAARRDIEADAKLTLWLEVKSAERAFQLLQHWRMSSLQSKFYRDHTAGRCVAHWRRSTTLAMTFGSSAITAQDVRAQKLKKLAFSVWKSSHKDAIASRVYQARLFSQWRVKSSHLIENRGHCAAADTLRIAQTLRSCFSHWRHQWDTMCPIKAEVDYVIAQWRLRRSLRQWSRRCAVAQHDRCAIEDLVERKNQSCLAMLWAKWKRRSILHRAEREFRSRRRVLRLHSLVGTWRERVWLIGALRNQALADALELHQWQLRRAALRSWKNRLLLRIVGAHETRQREMNVAADHHKRSAVLRRTMQFWYGASIAAAAAHSSTTTRPIIRGHGTTSHSVDTSHPENNTAGPPLGGSYQSYRSTVEQTRRPPQQQHSDVNHSFPDGDCLPPHREQSFFRSKPATVSLVVAHHHPVSNLALARARLHGINGGFVSGERNTIKSSSSAPWGTTNPHPVTQYGRTQPPLRSNRSHQEYENDNVSEVEVDDDDAEYLQSRGADNERTPVRRHPFPQDHRAHLPPQSHDGVVDPLALFEEADDAIEVFLDDDDTSFPR